MSETLNAWAMWLRSTPISEAVRAFPWLWPACEILHFFGLSLLLGVTGFFDLRLLGVLRRIPLDAAWSLMPWARYGFALCAVTGVTFFVGAPDQYINNAAFVGKVIALLIAGLNAAYFEAAYGGEVLAPDPGDAPRAYKVIGAASLVSWFFVVYWGRMLPFIGNAF
jgi:hypothetical protein